MFTHLQLVLLICALMFYISAGLLLPHRNQKLVGLFLFLSAGCVFSFAALIDPFLNLWDERFHALVAKNMINNPLKPMLYADPILAQDYSPWYAAHIWLHKQPLFMWQMALSMKLFGNTVFAMRLPSVLMSAFAVATLYRTGTLLSDRLTGFFAATIMLSSFYWIHLVTGRKQLDQNDVAFISYVSFSMWAFVEYRFSQKTRWLIMIGALAGAAILCKWLAGLFVYSIWILFALISKSNKKTELMHMAIAMVVTAIVAVPWQLYAYLKFPIEFKKEQAYNAMHMWKAVEGHTEKLAFYYDMIQAHYGLTAGWLLFVLLILFVSIGENRLIKFCLAAAFVGQFLFFTWAATKMPSFALVGWFIALLAMGFGLQLIVKLLAQIPFFADKKFVLALLIGLAILPMRLSKKDFERVHRIPENEVNFSQAMLHNKAIFESLNLEADEVLFNIHGFHFIDAMFYINAPVYNGIPSQAQIDELIAKGRRVAILRGNDPMPEHVQHNPYVRIIDGFTYVYE